MFVARTEEELSGARTKLGRPVNIALVPTMGALHDGHLALIKAARDDASDVIASVFVNPLQFDQQTDLARYPVDQHRDLALLEEAGCAIAWLPSADAMYPGGHATVINVAGPAEGLEGAVRAGHFRGVATVVAILLGQTRPHAVYFGEKDWQQLQVIRRMVADLRFPVRVRSIPTVRATDGLALSSRNRFLGSSERALAPLFHASLTDAIIRIEAGQRVADSLTECRRVLSESGFKVEYLSLTDGETLVAIDQAAAGARLLGAVRLGSVRLLDNVGIG